MNINHGKATSRIRSILTGALFLAFTIGASAQRIAVPPTPDTITPPVGNTAFLVGHATGTQGYICLPTSVGASTAAWNPNARPEATLFVNIFGQRVQVITHFLSPDEKPNGNAPKPLPFGSATWQSSLDSSRVWAQKFNGISPDSSIPSCPNTGSIACLLLQSIGNDQGPTGGKFLANTTFIQRLNTSGGSAPADGCTSAGDVGKQALVPYTADYYFYHATE